MHINTGEVIITQEEIINNVFKPLIDNKLSSTYLTNVMTEYIHSLYEADVKIELNLQLLFLNYIIDNKQFHSLQRLLQSQIFPNSVEVAKCLVCAINKGYPNMIQVAIDMYHCLKEYHEVIDLLLRDNRVQDAIRYIEIYNVKGIKAKRILEKVHQLEINERNLYIEYYSKAHVI